MAPMPPLDRARGLRVGRSRVHHDRRGRASAALALSLRGSLALMWLWLGVALIVDGVDGTLARKAEVRPTPRVRRRRARRRRSRPPQQAAPPTSDARTARASRSGSRTSRGDLRTRGRCDRRCECATRRTRTGSGKVLDGGALSVRPDEERVAQDLSFGSTAGSRTGGRRSYGSGAQFHVDVGQVRGRSP